jgi:hypothetical protein
VAEVVQKSALGVELEERRHDGTKLNEDLRWYSSDANSRMGVDCPSHEIVTY